jgi:hypothetical protein
VPAHLAAAPNAGAIRRSFPGPLGDHRQIFVQGEQHSSLEALWASDDSRFRHEMDRRQSTLVWLFDVPATGFHGRFDPFSPCGGIPLQSKTSRGI